MAFDYKKAREAGYSDAEIADHLANEVGFDTKKAREAGYSDAELASHLVGQFSIKDDNSFTSKVGDAVGAVADTVKGGLTSIYSKVSDLNLDPAAAAQEKQIRSAPTSEPAAAPVQAPAIEQPAPEAQKEYQPSTLTSLKQKALRGVSNAMGDISSATGLDVPFQKDVSNELRKVDSEIAANKEAFRNLKTQDELVQMEPAKKLTSKPTKAVKEEAPFVESDFAKNNPITSALIASIPTTASGLIKGTLINVNEIANSEQMLSNLLAVPGGAQVTTDEQGNVTSNYTPEKLAPLIDPNNNEVNKYLDESAQYFASRISRESAADALNNGELGTWAAVVTAQQFPQLAMLVGSALTRNPELANTALNMMGVSSAGNTYGELIKSGVSQTEANLIGTAQGLIEKYTEKMGFDFIGDAAGKAMSKAFGQQYLGALATGATKAVAIGGATEFGEEFSGAIGSDVIANRVANVGLMTEPDNQALQNIADKSFSDTLDDAINQGFAGMAGGGLIGAGFAYSSAKSEAEALNPQDPVLSRLAGGISVGVHEQLNDTNLQAVRDVALRHNMDGAAAEVISAVDAELFRRQNMGTMERAEAKASWAQNPINQALGAATQTQKPAGTMSEATAAAPVVEPSPVEADPALVPENVFDPTADITPEQLPALDPEQRTAWATTASPRSVIATLKGLPTQQAKIDAVESLQISDAAKAKLHKDLGNDKVEAATFQDIDAADRQLLEELNAQQTTAEVELPDEQTNFTPLRDLDPAADYAGYIQALDGTLASTEARTQELTGQTPFRVQPVSAEEAQAVTPLIEAVRETFGSTVVPFSATEKDAPDGFALSGKAHVNVANLDKAVAFVVAHEFGHTMESSQDPADQQTAQWLRENLIPMISEQGQRDYAERFLTRGMGPNGTNLTLEQVNADPELRNMLESEMVQDFLGKRMTDRKFLNTLAKRDPSGFVDFVQKWIAALDKMIKSLKGKKSLGVQDIDKYIKDLTQAKNLASTALIQWRANAKARQAAAANPVDEDGVVGEIQFAKKDSSLPKGKKTVESQEAESNTNGRQYKLEIQREARVLAKRAKLNAEELSVLEADVAKLEISEAELKTVIEQAIEQKKRFPVSEGWAPLELAGINLVVNEDTGARTVEPKWVAPGYAFNKAPGEKRAPAKIDEAWLTKVANEFTKLVKDIYARAESGDKNAQIIVAHQTWYRNVAEVLRREFGGQGDLLADLLGATSPNTPVDTNWKFSVDILRRFARGDFDKQLKAFTEHIDAGGKPSTFKDYYKIRQISGKLYGMNSVNAMKALTDMWRVIEAGSAPKARNFALNLIGQSNMATIDVWAARMLRRAANNVRGADLPRLPPPAEKGVTGTWNANVTGVTGEFGFGAAVMDKVSAALEKEGINVSPPDLQAIAWFAEKELWGQKGWTTVTGEGGSFEENIEANPAERYLAGFSIQQGEKVPEEGNVSLAQARVMALLTGDSSVLAARAMPTKGLYGGTVEESFDTEWTVKKGEHDPSLVMAEIARIANENNQYDIFVSKVLGPNDNSTNARPGVEVYFKSEKALKDAQPMLDAFVAKGQDGFTMIVDPRAKTKDGYIGIRLQYVPEISMRWDEGLRKSLLAPGGIEQALQDKEDALNDVVLGLRRQNGVAFASLVRYDTVVVGKENYNEYIDRIAGKTDQKARSQAWFGGAIRQGLERAVTRLESQRGQVDAGGLPNAGSADPTFSRKQTGLDQRGSEGAADAAERTGEGAVRVNGTHYSNQQRQSLDGRYYGTGIKGAEQTRVIDAKDRRLRSRLYFYVDEGKGVKPEPGVGKFAHNVDLSNLYDTSTRKLTWEKDPYGDNAVTMNNFESAVLNAGYSGYYRPEAFGTQGVAVLLGDAAVGVKPKDTPAFSRKWTEASQLVMINEIAKNKKDWGRHLSSAQIKMVEQEQDEGFKAKNASQRLNAAYLTAAQQKDAYDSYLKAIAEKLNLVDKVPGLKGRKRTVEKLIADYNSDVDKLKDMLRGTIETESLAQARELYEALRKVVPLADVAGNDKSSLDPSKPPASEAGYRDAKLIIDVNGVPAELIIAPAALLRAKDIAHELYEEQRTLMAEAESASPARFLKLQARIDTLNEKMFEIYAPAVERSQSSSASLRVHGTELSRELGVLSGLLSGSNANLRLNVPGESSGGSATAMPSKLKNLVPSGKSAIGDLAMVSTSEKDIIPQGKEIKFSRKQTETPEFKKWFGDSKVVDADGKPLVVYHGTPDGGFNAFDPSFITDQALMAAQGPGFYFADKANAKQYTKAVNKYSKGTKQLYDVYLSIQNPLKVNERSSVINPEAVKRVMAKGDYAWFFDTAVAFQTGSDVTGLSNAEKASAYIDYKLRASSRPGGSDSILLPEITRAFKDKALMLKVMSEELKADGVIWSDSYGKIFVAWSAPQIKSATANNGQFDGNNPDIRFSRKDLQPTNAEAFGPALDRAAKATAAADHAALIPVSNTPAALKQVKALRANSLVVGTGATIYLKGINQHNASAHNAAIPIELLRKLPELLADPIAIYDKAAFDRANPKAKVSATEKLYLVVLPAKVDGEYVTVALTPDAKFGKAAANFIKSVHTRAPKTLNLYTKHMVYEGITKRNEAPTSPEQFLDREPRGSQIEVAEAPVSGTDITIRQAKGIDKPRSREDVIALSRKQGANPPPAEERGDAAARVAQDKFNRFRVLQDWLKENGVNLSEDADVYLAETLMSGRIATRKEDFRNEVMGPLIKKTQKAGIAMNDIADFLKMQHAQEANKRAREIQQKPDATAFGVSDKEAKAALAAFRQRPDFAQLQAIANEWREITRKSKDILLKGGILSPEMAQAWDDTYSFYIPVKGTVEEAAAKTGTGKGLNVNGKTKMRLGHELRDEAIIENILRDHERAISLDEKNKVGKALIKFALEAQNEDIVTVGKPVLRKVLKQGDTAYMVTYHGSDIAVFDSYKDAQAYISQTVLKAGNPSSGAKMGFAIEKTDDNVRVMLQASPMLADNEVNVYVGGRAVRVQINDEIAARAYTNMGVEQLNSILAASREVNNWLSKVYTGYSPDFILTNPIRDAIQGLITLTGERGGLTAAKIFANYPLAMKELTKFYATGKSQLVREYRANGGSTGGAYLSDLERIGDDIRSAYEEYSGSLKTYKMAYEKAINDGKSKKAAHTIAALRAGAAGFKKIPVIGHFVRLMETLNAVTENALRVATYHTLVQNGETKSRAAAQAKNLMNFNRKGEIANAAGALYLFYNPSVQGTTLIKRALMDSPHRNQARALAGSMALAAIAVAALNMSGDDEDKKKWEQTPDHVKDGNIVITTGNKQIMITLPYGYRVFWTLGNVINDAATGKDLDKLSVRMASSVLANFSPFGNPMEGENGVFQLLPTSMKMALGPQMNEDSFGRPIAPKKYVETEPDSQNMNRATNGTLYAGVAEKVNALTGGSRYEKGIADVSPEVLRFWVKSLTGGTGQFVIDSINIGNAAVQGVAPEAARDIPVVRRFVRDIGVSDARAAYWERANKVKEAAGQVGQARKAKDVDGFSDLVDRKGELAVMAKFTEGMLKLANSKRDAYDAIRQDDTLSLKEKRDMMREIEAEEKAVYDEFIAEFDAVTGKK